jgi:uncharacterized membrane protein YjfL (UPF0719 family)
MDGAELVHGVWAAAAYAGLGLALLVLGFEVVEWLTPGKLRQQIWVDRDLNAAILATSAMVGLGIIVAVSIFVANEDVGKGLIDTAAFGLLGLILFAVAFKVIDWLTPGDFAAMMVEKDFHPAVLVAATTNVLIGLILAVSIIP